MYCYLNGLVTLCVLFLCLVLVDHPMRLSDIARIIIRRGMGQKRIHQIREMVLPRRIKEFLSFRFCLLTFLSFLIPIALSNFYLFPFDLFLQRLIELWRHTLLRKSWRQNNTGHVTWPGAPAKSLSTLSFCNLMHGWRHKPDARLTSWIWRPSRDVTYPGSRFFSESDYIVFSCRPHFIDNKQKFPRHLFWLWRHNWNSFDPSDSTVYRPYADFKRIFGQATFR